MKTSISMFTLTLLLLTSVNGSAERLSVPVYPGGKVSAALALTNKDLLPMLKDSLKALSRTSPIPLPKEMKLVEVLKLHELSVALADISAFSMTTYQISRNHAPAQIESFYRKTLGAGWTVVLRLYDETSTTNLLSREDGSLFGVVVNREDNQHNVIALRTAGRINIPKLVAWGKHAAAMFINADRK